jgi:formylglycine-generating enzyme required for sulfatase activity
MHRLSYQAYVLMAVFVSGALLIGLLPGAAEPESDAERQVRELVEQLGDDAYDRREAAGKALEQLSDQALPALRKASDSSDPEIRLRARQLIRTIGLQLRTSKTTGLEMVVIEAGEFSMGSPPGEPGRQPEESPHRVSISRPFMLGIHEVTQGQYELVMKNNPSHFQPLAGGAARVSDKDTSKYPVECVNWFEAIEFCNRLSKLDGLTPYYTLTEVHGEGNAINAATATIAGGKGYRLPTEAEWEYACRAGTATSFWYGVENTGREANLKPIMVAGGYGEGPKWQSVSRTVRAGSYPVNPWGIYDMHGNVAEWCWDWHDKDFYKVSPKDDPAGPAAGSQKVLRGGSWMVLEGSCRSASRYWHTPGERKNYVGFRVARDQ